MTDVSTPTLPQSRPRILSVGTATPSKRYSQEAIADMLGISDAFGRRFFRHSGIETRHLYVEETKELASDESQAQLLRRHRHGCLDLGREAMSRCLEKAGVTAADVGFLCCVSSTGMMMPGLTAMYIKHLGFQAHCQRVDIVGMGCNAALNGLNVVTSWLYANPGRYALLVCCEVNSAVHVRDNRIVTALVNSLFGDGCGALLVGNGSTGDSGPEVLGLSSRIIPEAWRAISYHWSCQHGKFELYLDKDIPNVLGLHSPKPVTELLNEFGLTRHNISHWLIHAGGKKVIKAVGEANGLSPYDVRHSADVLRQIGNVGSPTVIFSYEALLNEGQVRHGDYGVVITMGPGATVDTALIRW